MLKPLEELFQTLQRLIGLHRQLMDTVRMEHEALVQASVKGLQEASCAKQALIEAIRQTELQRAKAISELAILWKSPMKELTLSKVIIQVQGQDLKLADQFRSTQNALSILVQRIMDQNNANKALLEKSLGYVQEMKKNVLGERAPKAQTYGQNGQKVQSSAPGSRLISKEV